MVYQLFTKARHAVQGMLFIALARCRWLWLAVMHQPASVPAHRQPRQSRPPASGACCLTLAEAYRMLPHPHWSSLQDCVEERILQLAARLAGRSPLAERGALGAQFSVVGQGSAGAASGTNRSPCCAEFTGSAAPPLPGSASWKSW